MATYISKKRSFDHWDLWTFVKKRKQTVVTVIAAGLALFILDNTTIAIVAGAIVEAVWAITEYYFKELRMIE